jgi:uncharacterized protein (TIGR02300 family)
MNGEIFMVRDDWGIKRVCLGCRAKFYDWNKSPIICPICGLEFDPDYLSKRKTKKFQEKSDDAVDEIDTIGDEDLIDESGDDLDDDGDDIELDNEKS